MIWFVLFCIEFPLLSVPFRSRFTCFACNYLYVHILHFGSGVGFIVVLMLVPAIIYCWKKSHVFMTIFYDLIPQATYLFDLMWRIAIVLVLNFDISFCIIFSELFMIIAWLPAVLCSYSSLLIPLRLTTTKDFKKSGNWLHDQTIKSDEQIPNQNLSKTLAKAFFQWVKRAEW